LQQHSRDDLAEVHLPARGLTGCGLMASVTAGTRAEAAMGEFDSGSWGGGRAGPAVQVGRKTRGRRSYQVDGVLRDGAAVGAPAGVEQPGRWRR
jgi:hypothetical protein